MTTDVRLVPLAAGHLDGLRPLLDDPDFHRFTRIPVPAPEGFLESWLERYEAGRRAGTSYLWAVTDGDVVGFGMANPVDDGSRTAELGYATTPSARGRGVATATLRALTAWALEERGMLRVELHISADNRASATVAKRCGYTLEGTLRSVHLKQGRREDAQVWSILPTDPR